MKTKQYYKLRLRLIFLLIRPTCIYSHLPIYRVPIYRVTIYRVSLFTVHRFVPLNKVFYIKHVLNVSRFTVHPDTPCIFPFPHKHGKSGDDCIMVVQYVHITLLHTCLFSNCVIITLLGYF